MEAILRQWTMLKCIPRYPRSISTSDLQKRLEDLGHPTTLRTIQRDLIKLCEAFPLSSEGERPVLWFWSKDANLYDLPGMDPMTALTFALAERFLQRMLPPPAIAHLALHFKAANGVLRETSARGVAHWPRRIQITPRTIQLIPPKIQPWILEAVYTALLKNQRFSARYQKAHDHALQEYEVNPLGLVFADQIIYLVCTLWDNEDPKHLALHRFREITPLQKPATTPKGFRIEEFLGERPLEIRLGGGPIKLKVLFEKPTAFHLTETPLSGDQKLEDQPDGRVLLTATVQDSAQLHWWLLAFGDQVEVVGPKGLREKIGGTAKAMASRYAQKD